MDDLIRVLFGEGTELTVWQMAARTVVIFVAALALIRASGRRSFGMHSPFDSCTTVLLGAILSRAVVGASPFWATLAAATTLVLLHRAAALASVRWPRFELLISGHERELVRGGQADRAALRKGLITDRDLKEVVRQQTGSEDLAQVRRAVLERDGTITVIVRP